MILVDPLEVVQHPPLVGLAEAGLPPGDVLLADVTLGQVRGPLLLGVESPDATGIASLHDW